MRNLKKCKWILGILVIICICIGLILWCYRTQPLVRDVDNASVRFVQARMGGELEYLADFPEAEMLDYLQTCEMRRTGQNKDSYQQDDVTLELFITDGEECHQIILGADSFCWNDSTGHRKYAVLNASEVTAHLLGLLGPSSDWTILEPNTDEPERQEMTAVYLGQNEEGYLMRFKVMEDAQLAGQEIEMWPAYGLDLSDMRVGDHMRLTYIVESWEETGERFIVMQGEFLETDNT